MHPYKEAQKSARWKTAVAQPSYSEVDPVTPPPFSITRKTKVATAGSCFAQHIARHLKASGYTYFITEPPHPIMSEEVEQGCNYGTFSARYSNIYTTRQLHQLFQRAFGKFEPVDNQWRLPDGRFIDALRPQITPGGYATVEEMITDRDYHLAQVRKLLVECEIFIFTLALQNLGFQE